MNRDDSGENTCHVVALLLRRRAARNHNGALSRLIRHPFSGRGRFQGFLLPEKTGMMTAPYFSYFSVRNCLALLRMKVIWQTFRRGNLAMLKYF